MAPTKDENKKDETPAQVDTTCDELIATLLALDISGDVSSAVSGSSDTLEQVNARLLEKANSILSKQKALSNELKNRKKKNAMVMNTDPLPACTGSSIVLP